AANGTDRLLAIKDPAAPAGIRLRTWHVPGRSECLYCHTRAGAFFLGLNVGQLNKDHDYGGVVDNQVRSIGQSGLLEVPRTSPAESLPKLINPYDEKADLELRARTYLHVNCAICHVGHGGNTYIGLGLGNTLEATRAVGGRPSQGAFGISDAQIIAPGEP